MYYSIIIRISGGSHEIKKKRKVSVHPMACGTVDLAFAMVIFLNPLVDVSVGGAMCPTKAEKCGKALSPHLSFRRFTLFLFHHIKQIKLLSITIELGYLELLLYSTTSSTFNIFFITYSFLRVLIFF